MLLVLYIAQYASVYVIGLKYLYIVLLFAGIVLFLFSSWQQKFYFFSLMIFFPVLLSKSFPLPTKTVVELLAPFLCFIALVDILKTGKNLYSNKTKIYFIAIALLVLMAMTHYMLNPVFGRITFGSSTQSGGLKNYFLIFAGIATFFCSYYFFKFNEINAEKSLSILLVLCIVLGNLYMLGLFVHVPMLNTFNMGDSHVWFKESQYSSLPLRMMHALGTCLLLTLIHKRKFGFYFILLFINTLAFMVLGGGRTSVPIAFTAIFAYVTLINRKYLIPVLSVLLIVSGIYVLFLSNIVMSESKFGRAFKVEGGLEQQDEARYYSFLYMYDVFKKNPIIGKGIGYQDIEGQDEFFIKYPDAAKYSLYMKAQLMSGGHGSYLSMLSIFGIGGFFWLMILLWGSIYYAYRFIKMNNDPPIQDTYIAIFAFTYLLTISLTFLVSGHGGYDNMKFWFLAGTVAGIISKERPQKEMELSGVQNAVLP